MPIWKSLAALSLLISLGSSNAGAAKITFAFTGTITYGGTLAAVGSKIKGTFSYDPRTTPGDIVAPGFAKYWPPAPSLIVAAVEGHTVVATNLNISVWNNQNGNVEDTVDIHGAPLLIDDQAYPTGSFGFALASKYGNTGC